MANSKIELDDMITVGTLADKLLIPVSSLITELMKNGVLATVNEKIDFDTAQIIVNELGLDIELIKKESALKENIQKSKSALSDNAKVRPPVVAVMGHVDHGKTSILDAIRESNTASQESGGITQHISAYQIKHNDRFITFLDTPGHEAFAAIREHGAHLTDIVIIVVAADDGVKPQTIEAIRFAKSAGSKIIVAINKIDKEGADVIRVKQQLSEHGLTTEEWGGDTIICEVSAKTKKGIDNLLDMVLLVSDIEEIKADYDVPAQGLVIEAHIAKGRGPIAVLLVEAGKLKTGDFLVAGSSYAKIRTLEDTNNNPISEALPSMPVKISGLKDLPEFGDEFRVFKTEKEAKNYSVDAINKSKQNLTSSSNMTGSDLIRIINKNNETKELNILIKADVKGSLTSVMDSLKSLDTNEVAVRFVGTGVGQIVDNDIHLASPSKAIIYGFNVSVSKNTKLIADREHIEIRLFNVIYELIDDVRNEMTKLLAPEVVETELGTLTIKGIFKTTKSELICGGEVIKGKLSLPAHARILRSKNLISEVEVVNLKKGSNDAKEIIEGEMCGVDLKTNGKLDVKEGDILELFKREEVKREL